MVAFFFFPLKTTTTNSKPMKVNNRKTCLEAAAFIWVMISEGWPLAVGRKGGPRAREISVAEGMDSE